MTDTTETALSWWVRHGGLKGSPWAEYYFEDWKAPHRQNILVALSLIKEPRSLHEVGCNSGPNLRLIRAAFPKIHLSGSEAVTVAADMAQERLGIPVTRAPLPQSLLAQGPVDVIFSCYTLAYLDPEDVQVTVERMTKLCQTLILLEAMPQEGLPAGQYREDLPEWRHDYVKILRGLGWEPIWKWPLIPAVGGLNACLVAQRASA